MSDRPNNCTGFDLQTYAPTATLEELAQRNGLTRERVRQLFPAHAVARRSIRYLDKALALVRGEAHEARVEEGGSGGRFGRYSGMTAKWCEYCGRRIRGLRREVEALPLHGHCNSCAKRRGRRRITLAALFLLAALPAAGQALIPGVGWIERGGTVHGTNKRPVGCPPSWQLRTDADPWAATGTDPYAPWSADPEFVRLFELRYGGGLTGTDGRSCRLGGPSGGDPHGVTADPMLRDLFAAGAARHLMTGTSATHNGRPVMQTTLDAYYSKTVYDLLASAHAQWKAAGGGDGGGSSAVSPGWTSTPIPVDIWSNARRRNAVEPELAGNCWRHIGFGINTLWYVDRPHCTVLVVEPPELPPPPPPPPCGDGLCEGAETPATCPADCPVVEPEGDACTAALDLLEAALETARQSCEGRTP